MGAPFINALGDICETYTLEDESIKQISAEQEKNLIDNVKKQLSYVISLDDEFRDYVLSFASKGRAVKGVLDIYEDILKGNGIESDLNDGVFDEATYKMTRQKVYEFQNECITQMHLKDVSYDKLLDSKVFFEMVEEKGVEYPGYFSAVVQYESKGMTITKSLYVAVTVNNW